MVYVCVLDQLCGHQTDSYVSINLSVSARQESERDYEAEAEHTQRMSLLRELVSEKDQVSRMSQ